MRPLSRHTRIVSVPAGYSIRRKKNTDSISSFVAWFTLQLLSLLLYFLGDATFFIIFHSAGEGCLRHTLLPEVRIMQNNDKLWPSTRPAISVYCAPFSSHYHHSSQRTLLHLFHLRVNPLHALRLVDTKKYLQIIQRISFSFLAFSSSTCCRCRSCNRCRFTHCVSMMTMPLYI